MKDIAKIEETVRELLEVMEGEELSSLIEHSKRTKSFQLKKPELEGISRSLAGKLKDMKTCTRAFKGHRQRVRRHL